MTSPSRVPAIARSIAFVALLVPALACTEGRVVHEERSEFNHIFVVERADGLRELKFGDPGGPPQSRVRLGEPLRLELPYTRGSMVGLAYAPEPKRILVIGVGGGSMPMFLRTTTAAAIDAVDIDGAVLRVAKEWFGFREDERLRAHAMDGRVFIDASEPQQYDLIFLDAYDAEAVPSELWTQRFLEQVRTRLRPGGALVANVWRRPNPRYGEMKSTFQAAFPVFDRYELPGSGNELFVGLAGEEPPTKSELLDHARRLQAAGTVPFELTRLIERVNRHTRGQPSP